MPPVQLGEVMRGGTLGVVEQSNNPDYKTGDIVNGLARWQEYCVADGAQKMSKGPVPLPAYMSVLGMTGATAYFGLLDLGKPKAGETVVVSGAAGAVGQTVGQLAKIKGCRVVGIAGGRAKCDWVVNELGFDACVDYKAGNIKGDLKDACPKGIDIYFDNVGGEILDTVLTRINRKARIIICGAISQYNATAPVKGPANYLSLLVNRARMEGIVVFDYVERFPVAVRELAGYLKDGRMKSKEDVVVGLDTFPETLLKLFNGENFGKLVLQVANN